MRQRWNHFMYQGFLFFRKNKLTKRYIEKIYHRYELLMTENDYTISIKVMNIFLIIAVIWVSILGFLIGIKGIGVKNFVAVVFFLHIISNHMITVGIEAQEEKLLRQFEKYIGSLRHSFHELGVVEEAILDTFEDTEGEIFSHIEKIYKILMEEDSYEVNKYKETAPNNFFLTFLALCQVTIIYGDTIYENQSLFLSNLNHLKNQIHMERLKRDKIRHVFSGLIFITLMPVFFLKMIESWSISNLPELKSYYYGGFGIITSILIYLFTLMSYYLICRLKENYKFQKKDHPILEKIGKYKAIKKYFILWCRKHTKKASQINELLKSVGDGLKLNHYIIQKRILFLFVFLGIQMVLFTALFTSKKNILYDTESFQGITFADTKKEIEEYKNIIKKYTKKYEKVPLNKGNEEERDKEIREQITQIYNTYPDKIANELILEIEKRLEKKERYNYKWYYILISIMVSYFVSYVPEIILWLKKECQRMSMEDEIMQFQAVIIMLIHLPRTDVITILEWLENVSSIFKDSIIECMDYYFYDEEEAFIRLKEKEPFLPLVRIIENLEICDKTGIEKAFGEMEGDRDYYLEKRKQDNEIMISNNGVIGKAAAYVPLIITLGLYLIVPFILESISRFMIYISELNGI